jgi:hypothetical protein
MIALPCVAPIFAKERGWYYLLMSLAFGMCALNVFMAFMPVKRAEIGQIPTDASPLTPMTRGRSKAHFAIFWGVAALVFLALALVNPRARHSWQLWVFYCAYAVVFVRAFARARQRWLLLPSN